MAPTHRVEMVEMDYLMILKELHCTMRVAAAALQMELTIHLVGWVVAGVHLVLVKEMEDKIKEEVVEERIQDQILLEMVDQVWLLYVTGASYAFCFINNITMSTASMVKKKLRPMKRNA
jgi:hypothetical protein